MSTLLTEVIVDGCHAGEPGSIPGPGQTYDITGKFVLKPCVLGLVASTAIELHSKITKIAVSKAKVFPHLEATV
jgi:hypothetical protein